MVSIPMWGYYDAYTAVQIELMMVDSPIVVYDRKKMKGGKKGQQDKPDFPRAHAINVLDAADKWAEKYGKGMSKGVDVSIEGYKSVDLKQE